MEASEHQDGNCLVCHEAIEVFAIGKCDHPICYKCCTRMRALCEQLYCPICRTDLPEVFFMLKKEKFGEMPMRKFILNRKLKIQFENESVRELFEQLLEHRCKLCPDRYPEKSFKALRDHMRRNHTLFYCDICAELKIFSSERKVYNRQDLALHRRVGDKDDTSYKGHPLCKFCDERYLDNDELYKHLRKDHYFCHFCEADGSQEFFSDYKVLQDHFRSSHFLCEEGDCIDVKFENAFRSNIDLKSHRALHHGGGMSKQQAKQERTLNIDINLVPRPRARGRGGIGGEDYEEMRRGPRSSGNRGGRSDRSRQDRDLDRAMQASLSTMKEDSRRNQAVVTEEKEEFVHSADNFPALGGKEVPQVEVSRSSDSQGTETTKNSLANVFALANNMTVQHGSLNLSDFPTLAGGRVSPAEVKAKNTPPSSGRNSPYVSIPTKQKREEDFPELPSAGKKPVNSMATWGGQSSNVKPNTGMKPVSTSNNVNSSKSIKSDKSKSGSRTSSKSKSGAGIALNNLYTDDFPSLGGPAKPENSKWLRGGQGSSETGVGDHFVKGSPEKTDDSNYYSIIDRFSPVNVVSDSPKDEHGKSKNKKKKKDKETTAKGNKSKGKADTEKPATLRGNASLDNIASLLLMSGPEASTEPVTPTTGKQQTKEPGKSQSTKGQKHKTEPEIQVPHSKKEEQFHTKKVEREVKGKTHSVEVEKTEKEITLLDSPYSDSDEEPFTEVDRSSTKRAVTFTMEDDFPSLTPSMKGKPKPPPGFVKTGNESSSHKTPPGLNKVSSVESKAPPGFSTKMTSDPAPSSSSTSTAPMSMDLTNFQYTQPTDFSYRNQQLIGDIQTVLVDDQYKFMDFKALSGEFRKGEITSQHYYEACEDLLGKVNFASVFPELLALLPDITKQQELHTVHRQKLGLRKDEESGLKVSTKSRDKKGGAWTSSQTGFLACPTCRQVLVRKDYNQHVSSHTLDSDFPSLHSESTPIPQRLGLGAWVKAK